jgi:serine/threonine protein kinase
MSADLFGPRIVKRMPMEESPRYVKAAKLGEGTYGIVYKVVETASGQSYAAKVINLTDGYEGIAATTLREVSILRRMNHCNIVKFHEASVDPTSLTLILEFLDSDLFRLMAKMRGNPLDPDLCCSYAYQMLCGLYYLHSHRVIHRDIKPANLLIDRDGHLKICDFGLSRTFTLPIRELEFGVVTQWYRSPELLLHNDYYDVGVDIWSAGCVIAEMVNGSALFQGDSDMDMAHQVFRILGTPSDDIMATFADIRTGKVKIPEYKAEDFSKILKTGNIHLVDLLRQMLAIDPQRRITAKQALNHPFFDSLSAMIREFSYPGD